MIHYSIFFILVNSQYPQIIAENIYSFLFPSLIPNISDVYFYRKVQLLAFTLYSKFHSSQPQFNFPDINTLTIFTDSELVNQLLHHKILKINSPQLEEFLVKGIDLSTKSEQYSNKLRAKTIEACEEILSNLNSSIRVTAMGLDAYLRRLNQLNPSSYQIRDFSTIFF